MIVELKEKLEPNTFLFWDGKKLISVSRDDLLSDVIKRLSQLEEFQTSLLKRQETYEVKMQDKQDRFIRAFKGDNL